MPKQLFTITNPTQDRKAFVREMGNPSQRTGWRALASEITTVLFLLLVAIPATELRGQAPANANKAGIPVRFTDVREVAGITFQQDSTQTEEKYYLETMGTGVAWLDYDQDGLVDLFFVQS